MSICIIPANPGFFAVYPAPNDADPIIAWEICSEPTGVADEVWPITPSGRAGDAHHVEYRG